MTKRQARNPISSSTAGASIVMVTVMLLVFMILGAAVLTASATATAGAARRSAQRQGYYYARSALDVLDESLRADNGALGTLLKNDMLGRVNAAVPTFTLEIPPTNPLKPSLTLMDSRLAQSFQFGDEAGENDLAISYTGRAAQNPDGSVAVQLQNLLMVVKVTYQNQTYTMRCQYRYTGSAANNGTDWIWSEGTWTVQQVG